MVPEQPYELLILPTAGKQLQKLPDQVRQRIIDKIDLLAYDPRPSGARPMMGLPATYRVRVGDYRVLYRIAHDRHQITVVRVGHRRDVYR